MRRNNTPAERRLAPIGATPTNNEQLQQRERDRSVLIRYQAQLIALELEVDDASGDLDRPLKRLRAAVSTRNAKVGALTELLRTCSASRA